MAKTVQISRGTFDLIYRYHVDGEDLSADELLRLSEALRRKKEALLMREYYSRAKDAHRSSEERQRYFELYKTTKEAEETP